MGCELCVQSFQIFLGGVASLFYLLGSILLQFFIAVLSWFRGKFYLK